MIQTVEPGAKFVRPAQSRLLVELNQAKESIVTEGTMLVHSAGIVVWRLGRVKAVERPDRAVMTVMMESIMMLLLAFAMNRIDGSRKQETEQMVLW